VRVYKISKVNYTKACCMICVNITNNVVWVNKHRDTGKFTVAMGTWDDTMYLGYMWLQKSHSETWMAFSLS